MTNLPRFSDSPNHESDYIIFVLGKQGMIMMNFNTDNIKDQIDIVNLIFKDEPLEKAGDTPYVR